MRCRERAERFVEMLSGVKAGVEAGRSVIGGGSTPEQTLETWLVTIVCEDVVGLERQLRLGDPAVVARIEDDRLVLDLRTVLVGEERELARRVESEGRS